MADLTGKTVLITGAPITALTVARLETWGVLDEARRNIPGDPRDFVVVTKMLVRLASA
jgi:hypothetical protein